MSGAVYNIAGPEWLPLRDMVTRTADALVLSSPTIRVRRPSALATFWATEKVFSILGQDTPVSRRSLAFFDNDIAFDTTKADCELSFTLKVRFDEGIQRVLEDSCNSFSG